MFSRDLDQRRHIRRFGLKRPRGAVALDSGDDGFEGIRRGTAYRGLCLRVRLRPAGGGLGGGHAAPIALAIAARAFSNGS